MIEERPEAEFVAVQEFASGLVGTVGVRILDTEDGSVVVERHTTDIIEAPAGSGIYTAALVAPLDPGTYLVVWDSGGGAPDFESEVLRVGSLAPAAIADWRPTVAQVAGVWLRARTYVDDGAALAGGSQAGTFNENTRPTAAQAELAIDDAVREVRSHFLSGSIPEESTEAALHTATIYAALLIELSYFPEQAEEASPYLQLRALFERALATLVTGSQMRDLFGETVEA